MENLKEQAGSNENFRRPETFMKYMENLEPEVKKDLELFISNYSQIIELMKRNLIVLEMLRTKINGIENLSGVLKSDMGSKDVGGIASQMDCMLEQLLDQMDKVYKGIYCETYIEEYVSRFMDRLGSILSVIN